jgi:hypothetical protein
VAPHCLGQLQEAEGCYPSLYRRWPSGTLLQNFEHCLKEAPNTDFSKSNKAVDFEKKYILQKKKEKK